jgi:hypothetical protein
MRPWPTAPQGVPPGYAPAPPPGYAAVYPQGYPVYYGQPMVLQPQLIPYDGGAVPPGARVVTRARSGFIAGGASLFGSAWALSLIFGTAGLGSSRDDGRAWLALPVLGPLIAGGAMGGTSSQGWTVLILDTVAQGAGLAMLIYGALNPARYLVYDGQRPTASRVQWTVAPGHAGGPGATLAMRF